MPAPPPTFMVQVDRRHYPGQVSVHLQAGLRVIDGKRMAQTKRVIVIGEPQQMSPDGKAQRSGNRTILSSR